MEETLEHRFGKSSIAVFPPGPQAKPTFEEDIAPPILERCCSFRPDSIVKFGPSKVVFTSGNVVVFQDSTSSKQEFFVSDHEVVAVAFPPPTRSSSSSTPPKCGIVGEKALKKAGEKEAAADVVLFNTESMRKLKRFKHHTGDVNFVAFISSNLFFSSSFTDKTAAVWNIHQTKPIKVFEQKTCSLVKGLTLLPATNSEIRFATHGANHLKFWEMSKVAPSVVKVKRGAFGVNTKSPAMVTALVCAEHGLGTVAKGTEKFAVVAGTNTGELYLFQNTKDLSSGKKIFPETSVKFGKTITRFEADQGFKVPVCAMRTILEGGKDNINNSASVVALFASGGCKVLRFADPNGTIGGGNTFYVWSMFRGVSLPPTMQIEKAQLLEDDSVLFSTQNSVVQFSSLTQGSSPQVSLLQSRIQGKTTCVCTYQNSGMSSYHLLIGSTDGLIVLEEDGMVYRETLLTGCEITFLAASEKYVAVGVAPGRLVLFMGEDRVSFYDRVVGDANLTCGAFKDDEFAVGAANGVMYYLDLLGQPIRNKALRGHASSVSSVAFLEGDVSIDRTKKTSFLVSCSEGRMLAFEPALQRRLGTLQECSNYPPTLPSQLDYGWLVKGAWNQTRKYAADRKFEAFGNLLIATNGRRFALHGYPSLNPVENLVESNEIPLIHSAPIESICSTNINKNHESCFYTCSNESVFQWKARQPAVTNKDKFGASLTTTFNLPSTTSATTSKSPKQGVSRKYWGEDAGDGTLNAVSAIEKLNESNSAMEQPLSGTWDHLNPETNAEINPVLELNDDKMDVEGGLSTMESRTPFDNENAQLFDDTTNNNEEVVSNAPRLNNKESRDFVFRPGPRLYDLNDEANVDGRRERLATLRKRGEQLSEKVGSGTGFEPRRMDKDNPAGFGSLERAGKNFRQRCIFEKNMYQLDVQCNHPMRKMTKNVLHRTLTFYSEKGEEFTTQIPWGFDVDKCGFLTKNFEEGRCKVAVPVALVKKEPASKSVGEVLFHEGEEKDSSSSAMEAA